MNHSDPKAYVCYCGLYCKRCPLIAVMPGEARALFSTMDKMGWSMWGEAVYEEFPVFWNILRKLAETDETCSLCVGGCGNPECGIRICAQQRGVAVCALCDEYPCKLIDDFALQYTDIYKTNERIREIGLEAWLVEQEELVAQGRFYGQE